MFIYIQKYYSIIKKSILPSATTWMDPWGIKLSEISQTDISALNGIYKTKTKLTENRLACSRLVGGRVSAKWISGVKRYKL